QPRVVTWTLLWTVFEVIRRELLPVRSEALTSTVSTHLPVSGSVNTTGLARLRVTDDGGVEWIVADAKPRRGRIQSEEDRAEIARKEREDREAEARIDWTVKRDVHRIPALTYVGAAGCGNVLLYGWSEDRADSVSAYVKGDLLEVSSTPRTFDIILNPS